VKELQNVCIISEEWDGICVLRVCFGLCVCAAFTSLSLLRLALCVCSPPWRGGGVSLYLLCLCFSLLSLGCDLLAVSGQPANQTVGGRQQQACASERSSSEEMVGGGGGVVVRSSVGSTEQSQPN
jgi:hypothetical protein